MADDAIVRRFMARFAGLDRAYGYYKVEGPKDPETGKREGRRGTKIGPVTEALWRAHLGTEIGLGIVPIRDDGTCVFGAIDVDVYDGGDVPRELAARAAKLELPLVTCRTKSGGAHLYLFTTEPAPASLVRQRLMEWSILLGYPGVEVFPKQVKLASGSDVGNWINMPYQGGDATVRYAVVGEGKLSMAAFLDEADRVAISPEGLATFKNREDEALEGAPPCLQLLAGQGFPAGSRNNGLFALGVYAKKRYPDAWKSVLEDMNRAYMNPPLSSAEVQGIVGSLEKKAYSYKCKDAPINDHCSKQICRTRRFGVGSGTTSDDPGVVFDSLTKVTTKPPFYILSANGVRITVDSSTELFNQRTIRSKLFDQGVAMSLVKERDWGRILDDLNAKVEVVDAPNDASDQGVLREYVVSFCSERRGRSMDEILAKKPYTENGRTYFRSVHLLEYCKGKNFSVRAKDLYMMLREVELDPKEERKTIKGMRTSVLSIAEVERQTEPHGVPKPDLASFADNPKEADDEGGRS